MLFKWVLVIRKWVRRFLKRVRLRKIFTGRGNARVIYFALRRVVRVEEVCCDRGNNKDKHDSPDNRFLLRIQSVYTCSGAFFHNPQYEISRGKMHPTYPRLTMMHQTNAPHRQGRAHDRAVYT